MIVLLAREENCASAACVILCVCGAAASPDGRSVSASSTPQRTARDAMSTRPQRNPLTRPEHIIIASNWLRRVSCRVTWNRYNTSSQYLVHVQLADLFRPPRSFFWDCVLFLFKKANSANQCTTRIQETWLQTGFPGQLKLVSRQKPVPSLPRSWPKLTVPDSENFTQCVHSSKMTFFFQNSRTTHRWVWRFGRKGVFSCRHRSVSAYAQYSWETIGTIYRWIFMCDCDDDAVCIIIKPIIHQSWM
jgi:hypothetical protein